MPVNAKTDMLVFTCDYCTRGSSADEENVIILVAGAQDQIFVRMRLSFER